MRAPLLTSVIFTTLALALACGGTTDADQAAGDEAAAAPAAPAAAQVAYQTYNAGSKRIVFLTDTTAKATWRNMSGGAVKLTYVQQGDQVSIDWGQPTNTGKRKTKMKVLDACQLVQFWWLGEDGVEHADDSRVYTKDDPRCK